MKPGRKKLLLISSLGLVTIILVVFFAYRLLLVSDRKANWPSLTFDNYTLHYNPDVFQKSEFGNMLSTSDYSNTNDPRPFAIDPLMYSEIQGQLKVRVAGEGLTTVPEYIPTESVPIDINGKMTPGLYYDYIYSAGGGKTANTHVVCYEEKVCLGTTYCRVGNCTNFDYDTFVKYKDGIRVEYKSR